MIRICESLHDSSVRSQHSDDLIPLPQHISSIPSSMSSSLVRTILKRIYLHGQSMLSISIHSMMAIVAPAGTMRISGSRHMDILPWIGMDSALLGRQIFSEASRIVISSDIFSNTIIKTLCKQRVFMIYI